MMGATVWHAVLAQRLANAQESGIRMINPTIATTITMTTAFGSLKLWLATTRGAAILLWLDVGRIEENPSQNVRWPTILTRDRPRRYVLRDNILLQKSLVI
jgi:hypothetical protein